MSIEVNVASELLRIEAVFLKPEDPFTWASGIKSPIYCDNRLVLTDVKARNVVEQALATTIQKQYPDVELLMGTATAGIAHAALVADILELPMGYVRGSSKDHGRKNRIEGRVHKGQKVVVVEDLISTAGSVLDCVDALKEAGLEVLGVVSIFTYGMQKGLDRLQAANVKNVSLSNLDTLVDVAVEHNYINEEGKKKLLTFRNNPSDESWMK